MLYFTGSRTPHHHSERLSVTARTACTASIWNTLRAHFMQPDTEPFNQSTAPYNYSFLLCSSLQAQVTAEMNFIGESVVLLPVCGALSFFMVRKSRFSFRNQ